MVIHVYIESFCLILANIRPKPSEPIANVELATLDLSITLENVHEQFDHLRSVRLSENCHVGIRLVQVKRGVMALFVAETEANGFLETVEALLLVVLELD